MLEVVVIGAGIAGFAAALALWERGAAVTLVEVGRPGGEATGASAGMLAAQYEAEPGAKYRLGVECRARYPEFIARLEGLSGQALHPRWDGILVANLSQEEHEQAGEAIRWQREVGRQAELLDPGQAAELQPGVSGESVSYIWLPEEGQLDSQEPRSASSAGIAQRRFSREKGRWPGWPWRTAVSWTRSVSCWRQARGALGCGGCRGCCRYARCGARCCVSLRPP